MDLWSLGVILFVLLSSSMPFEEEGKITIFEKVKKGIFKFTGKVWKIVSEEAKDLIKNLLVVGIDVENPDIAQLDKNGKYQIGLCILDTRNLQASIGDYTEPASLRTYQFCIGPLKYFIDTSRSFCFGEAKHLVSDDINTMIRNLVSNLPHDKS